MRTAILIPARYNSSRFPGKMLVDLDGITLIERVYQNCAQTGFDTYVLTDDDRIAKRFDHHSVIMTTDSPRNGTERCQEALAECDRLSKYTTFINVQGDMPDVTPEIIIAVRRMLKDYSVSTAYTNLSVDKQKDPNTVKAIIYDDQLEWCGRGFTNGFHHLGVYGYAKHMLASYPKDLSSAEVRASLEQLRWLENGVSIGAALVQFNGIEINTPEDAKEWHKIHKC
jgi:3-deoxy-manno-octulosonate cytidylyltransferase (CMP-KDO synthetase)